MMNAICVLDILRFRHIMSRFSAYYVLNILLWKHLCSRPILTETSGAIRTGWKKFGYYGQGCADEDGGLFKYQF